jgi:transposase
MDSDKRSAQVERLEVVETGRRRRWSEDEKLKIVLESLQASRQVAATARRYGISRSLLLRWRRLFQPEPKDATARKPSSATRTAATSRDRRPAAIVFADVAP